MDLPVEPLRQGIVTPIERPITEGFWMLVLVMLYLTFRDVFITLFHSLPFSAFIANSLDVIVVSGFFLILIAGLIYQRPVWRLTPLDSWLILFGISLVISLVLNRTFSLRGLDNVVKLFRYLAVYYIAINSPCVIADRLLVRKFIIRLGLLLSLSAIVFYLLPLLNTKLEAFLSPAGRGIAKVGSVRLTFSTNAELAGFLVFALIVFLFSTRFEKKRLTGRTSWAAIQRIIIITLFLFAIYTTYKRAFLLATLGVLFLYWWTHKRITRKMLAMSFLSLAGILMILLVMNTDPIIQLINAAGQPLGVRVEAFSSRLFLLQLLSPDYWHRVFAASRGWTISVFIPHFITSHYGLFGTGPDGIINENHTGHCRS